MTIEILRKMLVEAKKNRREVDNAVLSSIIAAVGNAAIAKKCKDNITEDLVNEVLLKEKKTAREMLDTCPESRQDLLVEYVARYNFIADLAPNLLDDPIGIEEMILDLDIELIKKNRGEINKRLKGKVDMKIANEVMGRILK